MTDHRGWLGILPSSRKRNMPRFPRRSSPASWPDDGRCQPVIRSVDFFTSSSKAMGQELVARSLFERLSNGCGNALVPRTQCPHPIWLIRCVTTAHHTKLQQEVRHKSEHLDDTVLLDAFRHETTAAYGTTLFIAPKASSHCLRPAPPQPWHRNAQPPRY